MVHFLKDKYKEKSLESESYSLKDVFSLEWPSMYFLKYSLIGIFADENWKDSEWCIYHNIPVIKRPFISK